MVLQRGEAWQLVHKSQTGFTLIELMVVVAIIGIIVAIAIPKFAVFQSRTRQSEAKIQLKSFKHAAQASFEETGRWTCGACGWSPGEDDAYMYNYYLSASTAFTASTNGCSAAATPASQTDPSGSSTGGFVATATANVDSDTQCDEWVITSDGVLTNTINDSAN